MLACCFQDEIKALSDKVGDAKAKGEEKVPVFGMKGEGQSRVLWMPRKRSHSRREKRRLLLRHRRIPQGRLRSKRSRKVPAEKRKERKRRRRRRKKKRAESRTQMTVRRRRRG